MTLRTLAEKYPTDKFTRHSYLAIYENLFEPIRENVKNVLEVGIQDGYSFSLWNEYFFNAVVYGVDIIELPPNFTMMNRMAFYKGDAYNIEFVQQNFSNKSFDVLIDDGPHTLPSMVFFAQHYSKLLNLGGVLVIEDIQDIDWVPLIIDAFPHELQGMTEVLDKRDNRYDDVLIVLQKKGDG